MGEEVKIVKNYVKKSCYRFIPVRIDTLKKNLDITLTEYVLMSYIANHKGFSILDNNGYLSLILKCNKRSIIKYIKHLEELKYIEIDNKNSRYREIKLSFTGKVLFEIRKNDVEI